MARLTGLFRLGKDAVVKEGEGGEYALLSLAYDYREKGEDKTQWVSAVLGGNRVKAAPHLKQGTLIEGLVEDLHAIPYQREDGTVVANLRGRLVDFDFAGAPKDKEAD